MTKQDEPRSEPGAGTPEGYTEERPAVTELGEPGTPGAGMTPAVPHAADADLVEEGEAPADPLHGRVMVTGDTTAVSHHAVDSHVDAHTAAADDEHGHAEPRLGPIDWSAWAYALVGAATAVVIVAVFWVANS